MGKIRRQLTFANVVACLALFFALGGTVYAGSKINGKSIKKNTLPGNRIKKNTLPGNKIKKKTLAANKIKKNTITGAQINESKLGQVPNAANAANATNATTVDSVMTFSAGANDNQMVSLVKTANFELVGICDPNGDFPRPGTQGEHPNLTALVIYNRGSAPALAASDDEDDYRLATNEGIGFNFDDPGDGAEAMSTDGHFMAVPSYGNLVADKSEFFENKPGTDSYPFSTDCHFAGVALVG